MPYLKFKRELLRQNWEVICTRREFDFRGKVRLAVVKQIICYKNGDRAIFIHGFAKNEKSNLSRKEFVAFKELAEILLGLSDREIEISVKEGALLEVKP